MCTVYMYGGILLHVYNVANHTVDLAIDDIVCAAEWGNKSCGPLVPSPLLQEMISLILHGEH